MSNPQHIILTGNQAAAYIAHKTNEVCPIYPITPASGMSELVEEWSANQHENIYGSVPTVVEMQSEGGVAGALHGALQTGSLATTFTASQGLLLMMPNMYKIAAELTPNVIHVATRSIATHALSVFGDHSDIMAVRSTGYAFLGAASVQEVMDFALIAQAASLESRIPFVHFFDGFRTSHEMAKIELVTDEMIQEMIDPKLVQAHRDRALNPNKPIIRGTSQASDVFFQSREAVNIFYKNCPSMVQAQMDKFAKLTGRQYELFEYVGHPEAEQVVVAMASATQTIEATMAHLNRLSEKIGLIKVRLFRPFSGEHLLRALPESCKAIAVLDRTKEPGSAGEPLYLDIVQSLADAVNNGVITSLPKIVGGRFGLSSKEFTPNMVITILDNLKQENPKNNFTVGIIDDVTHLSLEVADTIELQNSAYQAIFYQTKSETSNKDFDTLKHLVGEDHWVQGYTECDYKKANSRSVSHLRIDSQPIKAPYLISRADFIFCDDVDFLKEDNVLESLKTGGTLLVHSTELVYDFWKDLAANKRQLLVDKDIALYVVNLLELAAHYVIENRAISKMYACFLAIKNKKIGRQEMVHMKQHISRVDTAIEVLDTSRCIETSPLFSNTPLGALLQGKGNELPVSALPVDGTFQTDTSKFNSTKKGVEIPAWDEESCIQCGACSMACPQGVVRMKVFNREQQSELPPTFKLAPSMEIVSDVDLLSFALQVNPDQCTSCHNCMEVCPVAALTMRKKTVQDTENWKYFEKIPEFDRTKIDVTKVNQQQLQEPLFKYALGVDGCGEAPYLKLISQLFGDRMLVANATGASSIFGGALPTTPWSKNTDGRGPAWSNSLFEDNAEFGLGFRLSLDYQEKQAKKLLQNLKGQISDDLIRGVLNAKQQTDAEIDAQRRRIQQLKNELKTLHSKEAKNLLNLVDSLVKKSVWIVGGDGWAYDIGFGGLDHVLASGENVNILVLDNEVYSNTGGQMSKATPYGASAKFAHNGKQKQKKDLGLIAMTYPDVYVGSVAIGADQEHTLKTFLEAESYAGPSLIIAYSHSPAHGIDMKNPSQYHKAAVDAGQWLLYRNDPRRKEMGLPTLQLDSKDPKLPVEEYLLLEKRFKNLFNTENDHLGLHIKEQQSFVDSRYNKYNKIARSNNQLDTNTVFTN